MVEFLLGVLPILFFLVLNLATYAQVDIFFFLKVKSLLKEEKLQK